MNCFDCSIHGHTAPAVAICHDCGAAICAEHATTAEHHLTRMVPLGRRVAVDPPMRVIRCHTCAAAATAAHVA